MRLLRLLTIILFVPSFLLAQTKTNWSPEQCMKMKNITAVRVSPDGSKVSYTVREAVMADDKSEYINQVYLCNSDGSGTIQLTNGDKNNSNPKWSADGKQLAFISARDGKNNIYLLKLAGGEAEKITDVKTGVVDFEWSPGADGFAFTMLDASLDQEDKNKKGKNDWYFYEEEIKQNRLYAVWLNKKDSSGKLIQKQLTKDNRNVSSFNWSPDGKMIVYAHSRSPVANDNVYSDISLINIEGGEGRPIAVTPAGEGNPRFSPDGKWIAYEASEDPVIWAGKTVVRIIPAQGGVSLSLVETPSTGISLLGWSGDSKYVYVTESKKTLNAIFKLGIDGKEIIEWNKESADLIGGISLNAAGNYAGFLLQNPAKPGEAYISSLDHFNPVKLTAINADIADRPIPRTEVISWKSFDGKEIEGLLTYPLNYQSGQRAPLILNVHGGPAGVFAQNFIAGNGGAYPIAAFAEMGYAVLRPNPRGSSGYGVEFRRSNERDWGGADFKDLMLGVDAVIKMGVADQNKLGVMGWSYGGFMSSWIVGHTDRFKVASIGAPVVNLLSQDGTSDIWEFLPSYYRKYHWEDFDVYALHSPIRYVGNVKTPVMLQHGEADVRVPFSQSMEFYLALKRRNIPVRLLALPRQPHGPTEPKMVLKVMQTNVEWFNKYFGSNQSKGF